MAKAPARALKVYETQLGFYDTVVAASSQAAALRAWGMHQNLFAGGAARIAVDKAAIAAALEHPEKPLRRATGSKDAFSLEPTSLPKIPDLPKKRTPQRSAKAAPPPRPTADRSALDTAEATLRDLDDQRRQEEAAFKREANALEARREKYRKAGGLE
jgi:hypothetical protein